jgi:hypothetical protein
MEALGAAITALKAPSPIMRFFVYAHLPDHLQETSRRFAELADWIESTIPNGPEKTVALRKLLEGKDAAVRARLP